MKEQANDIDDGPDTETWRAYKKMKQEERRGRRGGAPERLTTAGILFEVKNSGAHVIVKAGVGKIDFWPGTTKWIDRNGGRGYGIDNLIGRVNRLNKAVKLKAPTHAKQETNQ